VVSLIAPPEQAVTFLRTFLLGGRGLEGGTGVVNSAVLVCVLSVTTKIKGRQVFLGKKCAPKKILATPMPTALFVV